LSRFWTGPKHESIFHRPTLDEWLEAAYLEPGPALFDAISNGDRESIRTLLEKGIDPNQLNEYGERPLEIALQYTAEAIACDLIDAGARPDFGMPHLMLRLVWKVANEAWGGDESEESLDVLKDYLCQKQGLSIGASS
jgi:ankyrin repeat protein